MVRLSLARKLRTLVILRYHSVLAAVVLLLLAVTLATQFGGPPSLVLAKSVRVQVGQSPRQSRTAMKYEPSVYEGGLKSFGNDLNIAAVFQTFLWHCIGMSFI
ncbi:hypothetical protein Y032_0089g2314 [Ancylostoma ceylanicum]|uniref:Uncharacterized protein n=1 Tax=Ancylostoma ceylanicum TaxID=53326 RepID=A0A016TP54_9BILA|nr:hypothetical protein Y032_0089g2314 [Ancylostoma ceylanicum]